MKLCQKCIGDILQNGSIFSIDDLADADDLIEDAVDGTPESVKSVSGSECQFWAHKAARQLAIDLAREAGPAEPPPDDEIDESVRRAYEESVKGEGNRPA